MRPRSHRRDIRHPPAAREMRTHLYTTFVNFTKVFDTANRDEPWTVMQKFCCPERITHMVRHLHDGMMAPVTDNGAFSEAFAMTSGVKQGCVLAPTLFSLVFFAVLMDENEAVHQIFKSGYAFGQLQNYVWNRHGFQLNIKLKMYKAVV
ncbi:hypothetical protein SprV_0301137400 [Sparganum proliferum]